MENSYQALGGGEGDRRRVGRGKLTVFQLQLNCSYLHHNVKGVLVEQEHKKQTETLFSDSQWMNERQKIKRLVVPGKPFVPQRPKTTLGRRGAIQEEQHVCWGCVSSPRGSEKGLISMAHRGI